MRTLPLSASVTSTVTSGSPTATTSPALACSSVTRPANGTGTSTTALAVSTSTTPWSTATVSPTCTRQVTISASVRPSPRSGSRNAGTSGPGFRRCGGLLPLQAVDRVQDAVHAGQVEFLQVRRGIGDVEPGHPQDRGLEVVEALLGQPRGDLGAVPAEPARLVHDDGPAGAPDRGGDGLVVERGQA